MRSRRPTSADRLTAAGLLVRLAVVLTCAYLVIAGAHRASAALAASLYSPSPALPRADWTRVLVDRTPTPITVSIGWQSLHAVVPAWRLRSDPTLWLRMRLENWNSVPRPLREAGLDAMFRRYAAVFEPAAWAGMRALDWDRVPHPVRAMVVLRMIERRVAAAAPCGAFGVPPARLAETVAAIVMVESWFEHRAVNVNTGGDRDLGLAQASAYCRRRLEQLYERGQLPARLADADYFEPWTATGVATLWFLRTLDEADGDVALAIRAYHRGIRAARAGAGEAYLQQVEARRDTLLRGSGVAASSWRLSLDRAGRIDAMDKAAGWPPRPVPALDAPPCADAVPAAALAALLSPGAAPAELQTGLAPGPGSSSQPPGVAGLPSGARALAPR